MAIRVAIVEDNTELRESLAQLIQNSSGCEFAGAFDSCGPLLRSLPGISPDVILMDIGLPGMSGIEGVRIVKTETPGINVLMLTVFEDEEKIFESLCAGASGYLLKKTPPSGIIAAIREVHSGGAPMTASIARKVLDMFQRNPPPPPPQLQLTQREKDVLGGLVKGSSYKMIAETHGISVDTVRSHIKKVYEKLHVHSKSEAVAKVLRSHVG